MAAGTGNLILKRGTVIPQDGQNSESERTLMWNDPTIGILWPIPKNVVPSLSKKDEEGLSFENCEKYE